MPRTDPNADSVMTVVTDWRQRIWAGVSPRRKKALANVQG
jgi:hypothetical protein